MNLYFISKKLSNCLIFLATVIHSGQISMPQGVILPGEKEIMQGHKVHLSTHGACGVACWRVDCSRSVLAVMWSIPLHFSFWTNWMAIGIFPDTMEISQQIFDLMYSGEQGVIFWFVLVSIKIQIFFLLFQMKDSSGGISTKN